MNNTLRPRAKAALDAAIVYSPRHLHNPSPFSPTPFVTIEVDGQHTPQPGALLSGCPRLLPKRGIGNFWRWFNGFRPESVEGKTGQGANNRGNNSRDNGTAGPWATDDARRPGLFFHGTDVEIQAFDLDHPNRKDKVWLVRGATSQAAFTGGNSIPTLPVAGFDTLPTEEPVWWRVSREVNRADPGNNRKHLLAPINSGGN